MDNFEPRRRTPYTDRDWEPREARSGEGYALDVPQDRPEPHDHSYEYWRDRRPGNWQGDQARTTTAEQRDRGFVPREQYEREHPYGGQHSDRGSSYPYPRDARGPDPEHFNDALERQYRANQNRSSQTPSYGSGRGRSYSESLTSTGPHAGRGPKNYRRSAEQLVADASERLARDGEVDASDIEVTAEDGVIRLRGTVTDRATKRRAERCVESVAGVNDVFNELRIAAPNAARSQDSSSNGSTNGSPDRQH